jgi:hypothetical protein
MMVRIISATEQYWHMMVPLALKVQWYYLVLADKSEGARPAPPHPLSSKSGLKGVPAGFNSRSSWIRRRPVSVVVQSYATVFFVVTWVAGSSATRESCR